MDELENRCKYCHVWPGQIHRHGCLNASRWCCGIMVRDGKSCPVCGERGDDSRSEVAHYDE